MNLYVFQVQLPNLAEQFDCTDWPLLAVLDVLDSRASPESKGKHSTHHSKHLKQLKGLIGSRVVWIVH